MSHDRGCPCGKERWEYENCQDPTCSRRESKPTDFINDRQVGGTHYKTDYQHWDFATDVKLPYLESAASKYVTRWKKKNGIQDLEKSKHYIEKIIALVAAGKYENLIPISPEMNTFVQKFISSNSLEMIEAHIIFTLVFWRSPAELLAVLTQIDILIATAADAQIATG